MCTSKYNNNKVVELTKELKHRHRINTLIKGNKYGYASLGPCLVQNIVIVKYKWQSLG